MMAPLIIKLVKGGDSSGLGMWFSFTPLWLLDVEQGHDHADATERASQTEIEVATCETEEGIDISRPSYGFLVT